MRNSTWVENYSRSIQLTIPLGLRAQAVSSIIFGMENGMTPYEIGFQLAKSAAGGAAPPAQPQQAAPIPGTFGQNTHQVAMNIANRNAQQLQAMKDQTATLQGESAEANAPAAPSPVAAPKVSPSPTAQVT